MKSVEELRVGLEIEESPLASGILIVKIIASPTQHQCLAVLADILRLDMRDIISLPMMAALKKLIELDIHTLSRIPIAHLKVFMGNSEFRFCELASALMFFLHTSSKPVTKLRPRVTGTDFFVGDIVVSKDGLENTRFYGNGIIDSHCNTWEVCPAGFIAGTGHGDRECFTREHRLATKIEQELIIRGMANKPFDGEQFFFQNYILPQIIEAVQSY